MSEVCRACKMPVNAEGFCDTHDYDEPRHEGAKFKLFVDDNREIPKGWMGARTVSDTLRFLYNFSPIAEISLDHDILFPQHGIDRYSMYSAENYMGVAFFIATLPKDKWPKKIRIHSSNVGAARTMCEIMGLDFAKTYKLYNPEDFK